MNGEKIRTPGGVTPRRKKERRARRRVAPGGAYLDVEVVIQPDAVPKASVIGQLADISAEGCRVIVAPWTLEILAGGDTCMMALPIGPGGVSWYPAGVVSLEPSRRAPAEIVLRARFLRTNPTDQQILTDWLNELALTSWYT